MALSNNLPLQIQTLGGFQDQVLVLLHIAGLRSGDAPVTPAIVRDLFLKMHLPPPTNVSAHLSNLRRDSMTMQPSIAAWAVTPLGLERIRQLMAGLTDAQLKTLAETSSGEVVFGDTPRSDEDPINAAWAACRDACAAKGLAFHVATDRAVDDSLPKNVVASIWACKFGIAILEDRVD